MLKNVFSSFQLIDEEISLLQGAHFEHSYFSTGLFLKTEENYLKNQSLYIHYLLDLEASEKSQSSRSV